jgi:hypothetical protein
MFSSSKVSETEYGPCNLPGTWEVRNAYKRTVGGGGDPTRKWTKVGTKHRCDANRNGLLASVSG